MPKITLTLIDNKKIVRHVRKPGKIKFFSDREAKKWLIGGRSCLIKVDYGYGLDLHGKRVLFQNAGTYKSSEDLKWAYRAFYKEYL